MFVSCARFFVIPKMYKLSRWAVSIDVKGEFEFGQFASHENFDREVQVGLIFINALLSSFRKISTVKCACNVGLDVITTFHSI